MIRPVVAACLCLTVASAPARGQELSAQRGFMLGAHLVGARLDPEDGDDDAGGGVGIVLGWGFGSHLRLFLDGAALSMNPDDEDEDYVLGHGDLALRYTFLTSANRWRPFVEGGFSYFSVKWDDVQFGQAAEVDVEISGPGLMLGGGVDYFVGPRVALGAGVRWSAGSFDEVKVDNVTVELEGDDKYEVSTSRLLLGVKYFFSGQ